MASSKPSAGRPPRYKSVEEIQAKIDAYFTQCAGEPLLDANGDPVLYKGVPVITGAHPPTVTGLAVALGFTGEKLIGILVMLAAPATPSCYIMAKNMKNDGVLTASIVVTTTLIAAFTLTGWIFVLKCLQLIG